MADRKEFEIGGKLLSSLRVVDLKLELEKRGLSKSGSKKELADRLKVQLRLEKLQEDASKDEGHVPNLRLQDDEIAEQNDLIKDYLAKQQQTYEVQKEARRRVELEEQKVRDSSEAEDTSQGEEEIDSKSANAIEHVEVAKVPEIQVTASSKVTESESTVPAQTPSENLLSSKAEPEICNENSSSNTEALDLTKGYENRDSEEMYETEISVKKLSPQLEHSEKEISKPFHAEGSEAMDLSSSADQPKIETENIQQVDQSQILHEEKNVSTDIITKDDVSGEEAAYHHETNSKGVVEEGTRDVDMKDSSAEVVIKSERGSSSSPRKGSNGSESRQRRSRRSRSSSSKSSSSSRSKSSDSQSSDSRGRSRIRSETKRNKNYEPEAVDDSASQSSLRPELEVKVNAEEDDKMMDVEESSSAVDEVSARENKTGCKSDDPQPTPDVAAKVTSRKLSISTKSESQASEEGKENLETNEFPAPRKRKWGNSSSTAAAAGKKASLSISTDSLKGLIPELKLHTSVSNGSSDTQQVLTESAEARTAPVAKPTLTPTIKREMIVFNSNSQSEKDATENTEPPPKVTRTTSVRRISASGLPDAATNKITPSPARHPPSRIIHVRNLVRPFTLNQLKELLSKTGALIEGGFWIDKIKSKCYVTYEAEDQAISTRQALHGTQWPSSNPKILSVDFATQDELDFHRSLSEASDLKKPLPIIGDGNLAIDGGIRPKPLSPRARGVKAGGDDGKIVEKLQRESHRAPDRENKEKERGEAGDKIKRGDRGRNQQVVELNNDRDRTNLSGRRERDIDQRSRGKDKIKQPPIREWDRDKIGERSPGERDRARAAHNRNRSRSISRSRGGVKSPLGRRDRNRDAENRNDRRREEEAPAKLLDDLFRKTKTAPCIYWLPLTSEQIHMKEEQRKQRQVEREKRRQQTDQPESVKNVGQRGRSSDKEDNRNWRKSKSPIKSRSRRR